MISFEFRKFDCVETYETKNTGNEIVSHCLGKNNKAHKLFVRKW